MKAREASIEVARGGVNNSVVSVSIMMPVWHNENSDGNLEVKLPLLGIETVAKNEEDIQIAVDEAVMAFIFACENFGKGIQNELQELGWQQSDNSVIGYDLSETDELLERLFNTGDKYMNNHLELEVA